MFAQPERRRLGGHKQAGISRWEDKNAAREGTVMVPRNTMVPPQSLMTAPEAPGRTILDLGGREMVPPRGRSICALCRIVKQGNQQQVLPLYQTYRRRGLGSASRAGSVGSAAATAHGLASTDALSGRAAPCVCSFCLTHKISKNTKLVDNTLQMHGISLTWEGSQYVWWGVGLLALVRELLGGNAERERGRNEGRW